MEVLSFMMGLLVGLMFGFIIILVLADKVDSYTANMLRNVIQALGENKNGRTTKKDFKHSK